jgi:hypothetical protein
MKHKQIALRTDYVPAEALLWCSVAAPSKMSQVFKKPATIGLCAVELPDPPDRYQFCHSFEEADKVYGTVIANMTGTPAIKLMWFDARHVLDHDLVFAYAKKKETREEYLRRTVPEGYEWLGQGGEDNYGPFIGRRISLTNTRDTWDTQKDALWCGDSSCVYYIRKIEAREEYLKRTVPEGYEWVGRGTTGKVRAPKFLGRAIYVHNKGLTWEDKEDCLYQGNEFDMYYIRKIEQPKPEFDPQVGSKWRYDPLPKDTHTLEKLSSGKYVLLNQSQVRFCPATHCAKDAFGGVETKFTEVKD